MTPPHEPCGLRVVLPMGATSAAGPDPLGDCFDAPYANLRFATNSVKTTSNARRGT